MMIAPSNNVSVVGEMPNVHETTTSQVGMVLQKYFWFWKGQIDNTFWGLFPSNLLPTNDLERETIVKLIQNITENSWIKLTELMKKNREENRCMIQSYN